MPDFKDMGGVLRWLESQRSEDALAVAIRTTLRTLPLIVDETETVVDGAAVSPRGRFFSEVALPCFRSAAASWDCARYPGNTAVFRSAADAAFEAGGYNSRSRRGAAYHAIGHAAACALRGDAIFAPHAITEAIRAADGAGGSKVADTLRDVFFSEVAVIDRRSFLQAGAPLWPTRSPTWAVKAWGRLKSALLGTGDDWEVWTQWYEDRLSGNIPRLRLEVGRAKLPLSLWKQGPTAVNAEIRRFIETLPPGSDLPVDPVPSQGAGPYFAFSSNGKIALAPASEIDSQGNHVGRINQLLPLVRRAVDDLAGHLNPNAFPELTREVGEYRAAVAQPNARISWGTLFGLGVIFENAALAARRRIEDRLQPPLEDAAESALSSLLTLHGPLLLATRDGRELLEQADRTTLTLQEQIELRNDAETIASQLSLATEIIEAPAAQIVTDAAEMIGEGRHPARGTVFGVAAIKNVTIGIVGVASISAVFGIGIAETAAGFVAIEGLKKSSTFSSLTSILGQNVDRIFGIGAAYRRFVIQNQEPLRQIAMKTSQLRWMLSHIDRIAEEETEEGEQSTKDEAQSKH